VGSAAAGRKDKKKWKNTAICQIITIFCLWALRLMALTVLVLQEIEKNLAHPESL
jgi:hypothetical protein